MSRRETDLPRPERELLDFDGLDLVKALELKRTHFLELEGADGCDYRQLQYVQDYLKHPDVGCRSVLIERPYIDRDHMEDHSVFYSRNLRPYVNWCERLHFFNIRKKEVEARLVQLLRLARSEKNEIERRKSYRDECVAFSKASYLGFATIKPLSGCPVGRTVLRPYKPETGDGTTRCFPCVRWYPVHLFGVELGINGLGFQQQDLGVSACATTALWSSLQMVKLHEEIAAATPAQITMLASRYTLPFGRPMPSEGLSIDQMCMAVQTLGMSPNLLRAEGFWGTRGCLYAATMSGFAPILILQDDADQPTYHAVTVAGLKLDSKFPGQAQIGASGSLAFEKASQCKSIYIHDDRYGPYLRADLKRGTDDTLVVTIDPKRDRKRIEEWTVTHILVPIHPKIRVSFSALRNVALSICAAVSAFGDVLRPQPSMAKRKVVFDSRIERGYKYAENLTVGNEPLSERKLQKFHDKVLLPRYVGVVRITAPFFGEIDILLDTTSTLSNLNFVGIISRKASTPVHQTLVRHLSHLCQCPSIV